MSTLAQYTTGGATRPDALTGFQPQFSSALGRMFAAAPPEIQSGLQIASGYRSPEVQAALWQNALAKYGSPEAARKWVAPPGHSQHGNGFAADLKFASPAAQTWAHQHASEYGLAFPLGNEAWHVELAGVRDGHGAPQVQMAVAQTPAQPSQLASAFVPQPSGGASASTPVPQDQTGQPPLQQAAQPAPQQGLSQMFTPSPWAALAQGLQKGVQQAEIDKQQEDARKAKLAALLPDPYGNQA